MASSTRFSFIIFFGWSLFLQGTLGELRCEDLPVNVCSFSIASSGKRCLLENYETKEGKLGFECRTSGVVVVDKMAEYIETDECVSACGVDRNSIGISSDALLDSQFTANLCSFKCYKDCPNIVDLYFNLAAGEGVVLTDLCDGRRVKPHRSMMTIQTISISSSGDALSPGPAILYGTAYSPSST